MNPALETSIEASNIFPKAIGPEGEDTTTLGEKLKAPRTNPNSVAIRDIKTTSGCAIAISSSDFGLGGSVFLSLGVFGSCFDIACKRITKTPASLCVFVFNNYMANVLSTEKQAEIIASLLLARDRASAQSSASREFTAIRLCGLACFTSARSLTTICRSGCNRP